MSFDYSLLWVSWSRLTDVCMFILFKYNVPSRSPISKLLTPKIYEKVYEFIKHKIQLAEYYAVTTDMWTSQTSDPYMSFTIYWIDPNFQLQTRLLQVRDKTTIIKFLNGFGLSLL